MDKDASVAHRRLENTPLAALLARRPLPPDPRPETRRRRLPLRPREFVAIAVVVVAALVSGLATSGTGWGLPIKASAPGDQSTTEAVIEPATATATATLTPIPTAAATSPPEPSATATLPPPTPTVVDSPTEAPTPTEPAADPPDMAAPATEPAEPATEVTPEPTPTSETPEPATPGPAAPDPVVTPAATEGSPAEPPTEPVATATEAFGGDPAQEPEPLGTPGESEPSPSEPAASPNVEVTPAATPQAGEASPPVPAVTPVAEPPAPPVLTLSTADQIAADPEAVVTIVHRLTIDTPAPGDLQIALATRSSLGWPVAVSPAGDALPLWDADGDGTVGLALAPGQTAVEIVVRVTVPAGELAGAREEIALAAWLAGGSPEQAVAVIDLIVVNPVVTVQVAPEQVAFGRVGPDGAVDPTARGVTSVANGEGAWYVKGGAVVVAVRTNAPLTTACRVEETGAIQTSDRLEWRLTGTEAWAPFGRLGPTGEGVCLPPLEPGTHLFAFDVRLRVNWTDPPGQLGATLSLEPEQAVMPEPTPAG